MSGALSWLWASSAIKSAIVLAEMEREWKALQRRFGHFAEFVAMVEATVKTAA